MTQPAWVAEAAPKCPKEAAELRRIDAQLCTLASDAPIAEFADVFERMLEARDRLYEAWISQEMDA